VSQRVVERNAVDGFASVLGTELVSRETDKVVIKMPYREALGIGRIHGGAISALVDIAATAGFWSHPNVNPQTRGATVDFTIHFLRLAVGIDLYAHARVRRRGGTLCTGDVSVRSESGEEMAVARVTYKMLTGRSSGSVSGREDSRGI
jgi:uncharacterized protein (TIGR00369 family)